MSEKKSLMSHLHDLKLWQKNHDKHPRKKKFSISNESLNSNEYEPELSSESQGGGSDYVANDLRTQQCCSSSNNCSENFEDKKIISPPKTFKQLLEEKLQHDAGQICSNKTYPKRPFLKKGSGLERYGLKSGPGKKLKFVTRNEESCTKIKQPTIIRQSSGDWSSSDKYMIKTPNDNSKRTSNPSMIVNTCISIPVKNSKSFNTKYTVDKAGWYERLIMPQDSNDSIINNNKSSTSLDDYLSQHSNGCGDEVVKIITPLKMPTVNMDVKAKWFKVPEGSQYSSENNVYYDNFCEILNSDRSGNTDNSIHYEKGIIGKINEYAKVSNAQLLYKAANISVTNSPRSTISEGNMPSEVNAPGEQTLYEHALEKELRAFELLEEKVQNSSFCSTNSSVIHILNNNSPTKFQHSIHSTDHENQTESDESLLVQIQKLINNSVLKKPDEQKSTQTNGNEDIVLQLKQFLAAKLPTIFENENQDFNDTCNHSENQCSSNESSIINFNMDKNDETLHALDTKEIGINTSADKENFCSRFSDSDSSVELNRKLVELNQEIITFRENNNHIQEITKKLEQDSIMFESEMAKVKQQFESEKAEFYRNLEEQSKKLKEEKVLQDRCSKKDREEIRNLKLELEDVRETLKLKETKSGTSLARLRTHIKQLEMENGNLKDENNKLRQVNAKLQASQKTKSNHQETKLMTQINKKLDKLTTVTFKNKEEESLNDKNSKGEQSKRVTEKVKSKRSIERNYKDSISDNFLVDKTSSEKIDESSMLEMFDTTKHAYYMDIENDYVKVFGEDSDRTDYLIKDPKPCDYKVVVSEDGSKEYIYENGNIKSVSADGNTMLLKYHNGDIKETKLLEGIIKYKYSTSQTLHTIYADGMELLEFPNGQIEKKYKGGKKEIKFANGINKVIYPDKIEEILYPDGTKILLKPSGEKTLFLLNGQKEYHTAQEKRREYPDGSVKILHNDGRQETRYASGRIRIKDKEGNLILDNHKSPD